MTLGPSGRPLKARSIRPYAEGTALVALVTALGLVAQPVLSAANIDIVYMLGVLIIALRWSRRPAIFVAVLSTFVFVFSFVPPFFRFAVSDLAYVTTFLGFLVVGVATSELVARSRKLASEEAARALAEARSEAKDEILNHISHELRSPLNAMLGWAQLASHPAVDPARLRHALSGLTHSGRLLERLVNDLVTVSRFNSGKLSVDCRAAPLDAIVGHCVEEMKAVAQQQGVQLNLAIEPVGLGLVDEHRIEQVIVNLLSNAIKFTPSGGLISVQLRRAESSAELVVTDTGVGISQEFLSHVFEPFSQADRNNAKHGLGLGMAIVAHLVHAHGGTVAIDSEGEGRGTTVTVRLPVMIDEHASTPV